MKPQQAYDQLVSEVRAVSVLDSISSLLSWDQQTYLPAQGTDNRAEQQTLVATLSHERFTAPLVGELLDAANDPSLTANPASDAAVNIREIKRLYDRARKLPTTLVQEMTRTAVLAQTAWVEARSKSHFPTFEPWLAKTIDLKQQEAKCIGYQENPYDALLDAFEPGETAANVHKLFEPFRKRLVELVGRIVGSSKKAPVELLERTYPAAAQDRLSRDAAAAIGFDFSAGRLDLTVHPFCSGMGPGDTRMTTRYDEKYFGDGFFGVLHETGHALYEQGLPKAQHLGLPVAEAISLGIHESQSRMWENLVGRSRPFWKHFFPKARSTFGQVFDDITEDQWLFAVNDVRPSLIRTEADETTYNLHVMLRFEIEQLILRGEITAHDVPAEWNRRIKEYLGLTPPDDARGCLQDVHWSHGALGYFPTYTLGNLYAAQFFETARAELGDLDGMFAAGEFAPLLKWLREKIHRHGKRYTARQLVQRITGKDLSADALLRRLERNAREFYGV